MLSSDFSEPETSTFTPNEHESVRSEFTKEWARRMLTRIEQIWSRYSFIPPGWVGWRPQVGANHTLMRAVNVEAVSQQMSFDLANRVASAEVQGARCTIECRD